MKAENLTWPEFAELSKTMTSVIIPWGSMEAHGTHLPLSTDTIVANYLAKLIAEKIDALIFEPKTPNRIKNECLCALPFLRGCGNCSEI